MQKLYCKNVVHYVLVAIGFTAITPVELVMTWKHYQGDNFAPRALWKRTISTCSIISANHKSTKLCYTMLQKAIHTFTSLAAHYVGRQIQTSNLPWKSYCSTPPDFTCVLSLLLIFQKKLCRAPAALAGSASIDPCDGWLPYWQIPSTLG